MSDWPRLYAPPPPVLTPWSPESLGAAIGTSTLAMLNNATSRTWPANNQAIFIPFTMTSHGLIRQLLFLVGATSSGNIDVGVYTEGGSLIISSGSTAMSASTNTVQQLNVADTWIGPGRYFLAAACSTTSGTVFGSTIADETALSMAPIYEQASALPLPASATPAISTTASPVLPVIGIQFVPTV